MNISASKNITYNRLYIFIIPCLIILSAAASFAGDVILSWSPPVINDDGTDLTDLAGYMIYYGTTSGSYIYYADIGNEISYQIKDLEEGLTYYFAVAAYDTSGNESAYSNEVARYIIQSPADGQMDQPPPAEETCEGRCGMQSQNSCWCDDQCYEYGDCCPDYEQLCITR